MAKGLLAVAFDFANAHEDEFHDWYDLEHLPERQAIAGFGACERWLDDENPKRAVATYDLDSLGVLRSPAYLAIAYKNSSVWTKRVTAMCQRLVRFEGRQLTPGDAPAPGTAGGLLINAMNVAPEAEAEFNAWYDEEHLAALGAVPGCLSARRYIAGDGTPSSHKYVAIYHLEHPDVTRSQAWADAANTPWTEKIRPHFRDRLRVLTRRYERNG